MKNRGNGNEAIQEEAGLSEGPALERLEEVFDAAPLAIVTAMEWTDSTRLCFAGGACNFRHRL